MLIGWAWLFSEPLANASSLGAKTTPSGNASGKAKTSPAKSASTKKPATVQSRPSTTVAKTTQTTSAPTPAPKKKKKAPVKKRAPKIRGQREIEPERVTQIQEALAVAGYYPGETLGKWDEETAKAMRAYQDSNGFKVTGKPDALSLKKLGL
jgi:peptidoglycan hydrolase-like protein with peptidoglycan-binding domain